MSYTLPVLFVLLYNFLVFVLDFPRFRKTSAETHILGLGLLFFFSGMPALIYQIVWQRALFAIYGVNAESVAVVVSAFMLGLGLGSLIGGWASARFPESTLVLFGISEFGIASFGLFSLKLFHWVAQFTAGASLPWTVLFSLLLLVVPTALMGLTLPLLVQNLVSRSSAVGRSVATLYFANTFGSAVACYLCAVFLLRDLGETGSVRAAALMNISVGIGAFLYARHSRPIHPRAEIHPVSPLQKPALSLPYAALFAGITAFIALGFEILWFRVFALASHDRAPAFALLLSTYLAGIAAGSYISGKLCARKSPEEVTQVIVFSLLAAGAGSVFLAPLVALCSSFAISYLTAAPAFFIVSALIGSVFPLLCHISVPAGKHAGKAVGWTYVANILGSTTGSLAIGFLWMQHFTLRQVSLQLALAALLAAALLLFVAGKLTAVLLPRNIGAIALALLVVLFSPRLYTNFFEKLIFGPGAAAIAPLAHVVENRNGVIAVTREGAVFGNGVYDGYFNIDPLHDLNLVERVYALSLFHPNPRRILMIGLSSGSWAQILANHPQMQALDVVEINPGYLPLISQYPSVRSILTNPRVHIYLDDGRRWLLAHPNVRYDAIIMNTSFYWRDHSSDLLSTDFHRIVRRHLNPGGVYFFNTTESDAVVATGLRVFPYGLRVVNFLAVSDSPIELNEDRWMSTLRQYRMDGRLMFDPHQSQPVFSKYSRLLHDLDTSTQFESLETSRSLNARLGNQLIITDDNMGWEWRDLPPAKK